MTERATASPSAPSVGRRMATGAAWLIGLRFATRVLGVISLLIVARLLMPEDYGLIALATTLAALLEAASDFGPELLVIKDQDATRDDYDTAFTIQIGKGLLNGLVLVAAAAPIAAWFEDPRLELIVYCCAVSSVIQASQNIGVLDFRKHLEIHKEFMFQFGGKIVQFVVAVTLAYMLRSYWALMAAIIANRTTMLILSYTMSPYKPHLSLIRWRKFFHFTKWIMVNNFLMFGRDRADTLIVGDIGGTTTLGHYQLAHEIANLPTTDLVGPVTRALFPGYSMIASDKSRLAPNFVDSLAALLMLTLPLGIGIGLIGEPLITVAFGAQWQPAAPLITALAIFGVIRAGYANSGALFLALGKVRLEPMLMAVYIAIAVPLMIVMVPPLGPLGAAYALIIAASINLVLNYVIVLRLLELRLAGLIGRIWRSLAASTVMAVAVIGAMALFDHPIMELLAAIITGALSYGGTLWYLWLKSGAPDGPERFVADQIMALKPRSWIRPKAVRGNP